MKDFADRLLHARKLRQLSQSGLARAAGLSQGAIASYENRSRKGTTSIIRLAQALNVNPVWLDTGQGEMEAVSYPPGHRHPRHTLSEGMTPANTDVLWPFESISAHMFWSLTAADRRIVEQTLGSLIDALYAKTDTRPQRDP